MQVYVNQDSHYGFRNVPWISPSRAWSAFQASPGLFAQTPAQVVAAENFRISNSEYIAEGVDAYYLQADLRLFSNRLRLLTGVRREETTDEGEGLLFDPNAVFLRNANGTFVRNAQGARVRRPEAGLVGSMEELRLVRLERAYKARRTYEGYYPSFHASWEFSEKLLARFAYARTYGRPAFTDIIPSATINELDLGADQIADPSIAKGTITVRNTGLQPWTADNYDLSLEYYHATGGVISGGVFVKEIRDFFGDAVRLATAEDLEEVGLDSPAFEGLSSMSGSRCGPSVRGAVFSRSSAISPSSNWRAGGARRSRVSFRRRRTGAFLSVASA
jgi:outer membrane receptor protein involved in Fe transport